ncbi:hypothetical protein EHS25_007297 [Saitozyma podzolica]|uniref:Uncharacterized protein n=1 Tax=Saitozyma podzolica TaxID=1890683 RepID=A0A427XMJ1_9TREE|nr:hypothetical protein EHS25_007297 [Saitozyma podzolica]
MQCTSYLFREDTPKNWAHAGRQRNDATVDPLIFASVFQRHHIGDWDEHGATRSRLTDDQRQGENAPSAEPLYGAKYYQLDHALGDSACEAADKEEG